MVWLASFWILNPETWHRIVLGYLVIPSIFLLPAARLRTLLKSIWLAVAGCLLVWQMLSRGWSGGENSPPGWSLDVALVFGLLCALLTVPRERSFDAIFLPMVSILSAAVSLVSLFVFYSPAARSPAVDRLRNVFFHEDGLNAVPTGFLFAFGAMVAVWWLIIFPIHRLRPLIAVAMSSSLLGLLATQSRGPMLMFIVGMLCVICFARKRAIPALWITSAVTAGYLGILLLTGDGREATLDLVGRGTTGRFDIYRWFLGQMSVRDFLFGTGMARAPVMPAEAIGWEAGHPHSIYLTQLYQTGIVGLSLLLGLLAAGLRAALAMARRGEPLWLCLLGGACSALVFDGAQVFSMYSLPRVEILLVAVPAAIAIGKAAISPQEQS